MISMYLTHAVGKRSVYSIRVCVGGMYQVQSVRGDGYMSNHPLEIVLKPVTKRQQDESSGDFLQYYACMICPNHDLVVRRSRFYTRGISLGLKPTPKRVLVLGNAQLAQIVGARGPNMQTNAACAGSTLGVAMAQVKQVYYTLPALARLVYEKLFPFFFLFFLS